MYFPSVRRQRIPDYEELDLSETFPCHQPRCLRLEFKEERVRMGNPSPGRKPIRPWLLAILLVEVIMYANTQTDDFIFDYGDAGLDFSEPGRTLTTPPQGLFCNAGSRGRRKDQKGLIDSHRVAEQALRGSRQFSTSG